MVSPGVKSYRKFLEEMTLNQKPEGSTEQAGTWVSDRDKIQSTIVFLHRMKKHTFLERNIQLDLATTWFCLLGFFVCFLVFSFVGVDICYSRRARTTATLHSIQTLDRVLDNIQSQISAK